GPFPPSGEVRSGPGRFPPRNVLPLSAELLLGLVDVAFHRLRESIEACDLLRGQWQEGTPTVPQPPVGQAGQMLGCREDVDLDQGGDRLVDPSLHPLSALQITAP